ncbi:response regulator [Gleimia hominis]|uniref:response regulator n=1 Tax=Gleimia hominis TaxID=595468 RepID=UPI000C80BE86|nr:response regulator transcription factor [Gleimia hominis]WIK63861.1 response regulator transcription factor [Gleimia hominis]
MSTIVVVEDEDSLRTPLAFNLRKDGYDVVEFATGLEALELLEKSEPALVLLDLMLPDISGTEVCRRLRKFSNVPVIMVTAKTEVVDRVVGLEIGADDYVTKPYSYRELLARIRALLRRNTASTTQESTDEVLEAPGIQMFVDRHEVIIHGESTHLPLREFELLELFLRNANRVLTRSQILSLVWGSDYMADSKTLDVHIRRLRARIEADSKHPKILKTVRGLGYRLVT